MPVDNPAISVISNAISIASEVSGVSISIYNKISTDEVEKKYRPCILSDRGGVEHDCKPGYVAPVAITDAVGHLSNPDVATGLEQSTPRQWTGSP